MDTRWAGRNLVKGNQLSWEEVPPVDLTLRLTDVLQDEDCNPTDLWEAFRNWMESRGINRPQARPISYAPCIKPLGSNLVKGNRISWEDVPPVDLALRLTDILQYDSRNTTDLWEAFRDWMETRGITRPQARPISFPPRIKPFQMSKSSAVITQDESAMQLTRLVYTSRHENLGSVSLDTILQSSQKNNTRDLVTGVLVVEEDNFLQLIEGSRDAVAKCFERIMADKRHHDVQVISCGDVSKRLFKDWSMRLVTVSRIKREILSAHTIDGKFQPRIMSEFTIEEFCRALTLGDIETNAA